MDSFAPADPVQLARIIARGAALGSFGPECAEEGAVGPEGAEDLAPLRVLRALPHMTLPAPLFGVIPGEMMSPLAYALHVGAPARTLAFLVGAFGAFGPEGSKGGAARYDARELDGVGGREAIHHYPSEEGGAPAE